MIDQELLVMINIGEAVVVVIAAQSEVVKLGQVINQSSRGIEAGKIQFAEAVVEEELLHDPNLCKEGLGDARLIEQAHPRRDQHIVFFAAVNQGYVGGVEKRRVNRNREGLILLNLLQDLLLADVAFVRARHWVSLIFTAGRDVWTGHWIGLTAQQPSAVLSLTGRCLALGWLTCQNERRCARDRQAIPEEITKTRGHET